jgi:hypothetical protein
VRTSKADHATPEDFVTNEDVETMEKHYQSPYTVESMKKHHDDVAYYRNRDKAGKGDWFSGRVSQAYKDNYDKIKWRKP